MSLKGTLIGTAAGFFMGGPIGALIGGILGNIISGQEKGARIPDGSFNSKDKARGEFTISLVVLFAVVIRADGITKKQEILFVKDYLIKNFGKNNAADLMKILKELVEKNIDQKEVCLQIKDNLTYPERLELIHLLFGLAVSDGELVEKEVESIARISSLLGIYNIDLNRIAYMFAGYARRHERFESGGHKEYATTTDKLKNAYEILGLHRNSTKEEVRAAYRTLTKKYHPDRVNHLGPEYIKTATEKFVKIKEAYDTVMEQAF